MLKGLKRKRLTVNQQNILESERILGSKLLIFFSLKLPFRPYSHSVIKHPRVPSSNDEVTVSAALTQMLVSEIKSQANAVEPRQNKRHLAFNPSSWVGVYLFTA